MDQPDALVLEGLHVDGGEVHAVGEDAAGPDQAEVGQAFQGVLPAAVVADLAVGGAFGQVDVQADAHAAADAFEQLAGCAPRG